MENEDREKCFLLKEVTKIKATSTEEIGRYRFLYPMACGCVMGLFMSILLFPDSTVAREESLQEMANDPVAILPQIQLQNFYAPENFGGKGYSNQFIVRPVIPIRKSKYFPFAQILRPTFPIVTTTDPDRTTGLGDILVLDIFRSEDQGWGFWGLGPVAVFPTATDDRLGQEKWQLGPAAAVAYNRIKNLLVAFIAQNPISFSGADDRDDVNTLLFQPIVIYDLPKGWYVGTSPIWIFDWEQDTQTVPLDIRVGRVTNVWGQDVNMFVAPQWTAIRDGPTSKWGITFALRLLFPE